MYLRVSFSQSFSSKIQNLAWLHITDQGLSQGDDAAVQFALHAQDAFSHRVHVELKPGQLSLEIPPSVTPAY